jgi:hypothetical protein
MPHFSRYIGIDYSGAETASSSLPGLRVYAAGADRPPKEIAPTRSSRKHWTRRGIAEWLVAALRGAPPALVGIDHAFSFPLRYFEAHRLRPDWAGFLDDFQRHWPTDEEHTSVNSVRQGRVGQGALRTGQSRWRRLTEERSRAKSVFHFDVPGSVAKSTHAGLPWLRFIRGQLGPSVHFWPFDGWVPPPGRSVVAEVYPALWSRGFPAEGRNEHQQDAYSVALWMQRADAVGGLPAYFEPHLTLNEKGVAQIEGWILGLA